MCTVTIIPKGNKDFILTSNRDEAPDRESLAPDFYIINNTRVLFPKDKVAGGTWIGLSEKNRLVCVLNGAFNWHERKSNYRISRGVVAKDFMVSENIIDTIENYNLDDVEPFTIVIADWNKVLKFYELVWDGAEKHLTQLPIGPKIWSSSSLYLAEMKEERSQWFETFKSQSQLDPGSVLKFHKTAGKGNADYGVIMNRGFVKTTSITQIIKKEDSLIMQYENLQNKTVTTKTFNLPQVVNG